MLISIGKKFADKGSFSTPGKSEFTTEYLGKSNNRFDVATSILRSRLCPKLGTIDKQSQDNRAYIKDMDIVRDGGNWFIWHITTLSTSEWDPDQDDNPLDRRARLVLSSDQYTIQTYTNTKGRLIYNAAGTIVPQAKEQSRWVMEVEKNVKILPEAIMRLNNKINAGAMYIRGVYFPRRTLMVKGIRGEEQTASLSNKKKLDYIAVRFQLHYRREGWKSKFPNVDLVEKKQVRVPRIAVLFDKKAIANTVAIPGNTNYVLLKEGRTPILDVTTGKPVTDPWPLDKNGLALPQGYKPTDIIMLEEDIYEEANLSILPLS